MIVFRKQEKIVSARDRLGHVRQLLQNASDNITQHERVVELFIEFGEFESAVIDVLCMEADDEHPLERLLRTTAIAIGEALYRSWNADKDALACALSCSGVLLNQIEASALPDKICSRVSEGFVHYGIVPETYLLAAEKFSRQFRPKRVVCIGIRSIGSALSGAVAAVMRVSGCNVETWTVRPRAHPFDRKILITSRMAGKLQSHRGWKFLVVDEGPGLSGSSLCATARLLSQMGAADDEVFFFPCWEPDGSQFVNFESRERWMRHQKFTATFEDAWLYNGRFSCGLDGLVGLAAPELEDISAGRWRQLFYAGEADFPAVHPHHEQRKYLGFARGDSRILVKFAGLGRYGRSKLARQEKLSCAGFAPPPSGLVNGFLVSQFISGRPFSRRDFTRKELINTMANYLAYLKKTAPAEESTSPEEISHMLSVNVREGLGEEWAQRVDRMQNLREIFRESNPVDIDGRMLPHEWISTQSGYFKTDCVDHAFDQFFPRSQDISWDIAGACIEFGFDRQQRDYLIERYQSLTKDSRVRWKLPYYSIAYLAFRLGYARLASDSIADTPDGMRLSNLAEHYGTVLRRLLTLYC